LIGYLAGELSIENLLKFFGTSIIDAVAKSMFGIPGTELLVNLVDIIKNSDKRFNDAKNNAELFRKLSEEWRYFILPNLLEKPWLSKGWSENIEELITFYEQIGYKDDGYYHVSYPTTFLVEPVGIANYGENFISTQLGCMAYLNKYLVFLLEHEEYEEAMDNIRMQREFIDHLTWIQWYTLNEEYLYYGRLQMTKVLVMSTITLIRGFFS
jgi:hypothetical protein